MWSPRHGNGEPDGALGVRESVNKAGNPSCASGSRKLNVCSGPAAPDGMRVGIDGAIPSPYASVPV
jgi:hypothetical protein